MEKGGEGMDCPYLETCGEESICNVSTRCMKPRELEMARYCKMEEHYRCPILLAHILREGSSERPYCAEIAYA
jgi:hypothetical protein